MRRSLSGDIRAALGALVNFVARAPRWFAGVLAGTQAALLGLLVVVAPAMASVASAPSGDGVAGVDYGGATAVAARIWLLAHGVPIETGQATIALVPLGLTLLYAAIIAAVSRRFAAKSWGSWLFATASYVATVSVGAAWVWAEAENTSAVVLRAGTVAFAIAAPSVALGIWRAHGAEFGWVMQIPRVVRHAVRMGLATTAAMIAVGATFAVAWAFAGRHAIADASTALTPDTIGGLSLAIGQTMYAPVIAIWMVAWMTGDGFVVGAGNLFTPSTVATDGLPLVPILGALPGAGGGALVWVPLVVVMIGALVWWRLRWRSRGTAALGAAALALVVVALVLAALTWVASGAIGPGTLAVSGGAPASVALTATGLVGAGYLAAAVAAGLLRLVSSSSGAAATTER